MKYSSFLKISLIVIGMVWLPARAYNEDVAPLDFGKASSASRDRNWMRAKGVKPAANPFFFTHTARSGSLHDGRLALEGVSRSVLAVSVRPLRSLHRVSTADFTANWEDQFGNNSPNAVLSTSIGGKEQDIAVILSGPSYNFSSARVEYEARAVSGSTLPTAEFGRTTLFIDSTPINSYVLKVQAGDQPPQDVSIRLGEIVIVVPGHQQGTIELRVEQANFNNRYLLEVTNLASQPVVAQILRGDVPISSARICQDCSLQWFP